MADFNLSHALNWANGIYLAALACGVIASVFIVLLSNAANRAASVQIAEAQHAASAASERAESAKRDGIALALELEKERSARLELEAKLGDLDRDFVADYEAALK